MDGVPVICQVLFHRILLVFFVILVCFLIFWKWINIGINNVLLLSPDPLSNWCAAVALSHCLKGNPTQKEQLLRVQLATSVGEFPNSLDCSSYIDYNFLWEK